MLRILREHAQSWMLKAILILVALSFILFFGGYAYFREKKETYVAKVNRTTIEWREYDQTVQNTIKQYREAFGPSFSEKMFEELHLKEQILDGLINKILLLQEAKSLGLSVSDEELRDAIEANPGFQENGQFDNRKFQWLLRSNHISQEEYEQSQRQDLLISKLVNIIKLNEGQVSEDEVLDTYLFENERLNLAFLKISPDSLKNQVTPNEVEIKDYFQKHQEEFRIPTLVQVQYLLFRPSDFEKKIQVSSDEAKRLYDSRKDAFKIPKQVRVSDILIKVGPQDTPDKIQVKKKKAEEILEKAGKTKDFGGLAKQYSEGESRSRGGDLGWIQRGALGEQIEPILFDMKPGDLSRVLTAKDGFHIFKVMEVREEKLKPFDTVKGQILLALEKEKAKAEASQKADEAFYALFKSRDLETYSKDKGIPIKTTGFFKQGEEIPEVGKNPLFSSSAFSLRVGEISPVVDVAPNFYILKLVNKKESRLPPLNEVKEEVIRRVTEAKTEEKARQISEQLLNQMRAGKHLREIAKEKGYSLEETGFFTRTAAVVPKIGPSKEWIGTLASLTDKNSVPKEVIHTKDGYFVVTLSGYEPADQSKFQSVKKNIEKRLSYQKQEEALQNWIDQLRSKAKIEKNPELLKG